MRSFVFLLCLTVGMVVCQSDCGGNCPSGACEACPCGYSSNYTDIGTAQGWMGEAGIDVDVFTCIAQGESEFNQAAMNQNGNEMVVGLFQEGTDNGGAYSPEALCIGYVDCQAAASLMSECGICPWLGENSCFDPSCCAGGYCDSGCQVGDKDRIIARATLKEWGIY